MKNSDSTEEWKIKYYEQYALVDRMYDLLIDHKVLDHDSLSWHERRRQIIEDYGKTHSHVHYE